MHREEEKLQLIRIHAKEFENEKEIHGYLADQLGFPEHYGQNLSALYDMLTEICEDTRIEMDLSGTEDDLADAAERMAEVMEDAADSNGYLEFAYME